MTQLRGLLPILATPFHSDGSLDLESLSRLVEFEVAAGADGVATFGLASETFALDTSERQQILETVVATLRRVAPQLTVVAGVAATGYAPAREQALQAVDAGAKVLMVLPPFLVPSPADQLAEFYGSLAADSGVPIMVQDAPATTGVTMSIPVIAELAQLPGVEYIKIEAQPTAVKIALVVAAISTTMTVFGGQNSQFLLEELERGAVGTMPACEFTDLLAQILAARQRGEHDAALEQFNRLLPLLVYGLQNGIAWAVHKEVLVRRGIISDSRVRAPGVALDKASREGLHRLLRYFEGRPGWRR